MIGPTASNAPSPIPAQPASAAPKVPATIVAPGAPLGPLPSYQYDLTLDPKAGSLTGHGSITVKNTQVEALDHVDLRLWANAPGLAKSGGSATFDNVSVNGSSAKPVVNRTLVSVPLATPLAAGESATIEFDTAIRLPNRMGRTGRSADGSLFFGNAFPVVSVRDDEGFNNDPYVTMGESFYNLSADWKVTLHAPEDQKLITTGTAASDTVKDGVRTLVVDAPRVRDFIAVAGKDFTEISRDVDGTKVRLWAPARDAGSASKLLDTTANSLAFYNAHYGKYDYPEIDTVLVHGMGGGMEYPNVTLNEGGSGSYAAEVVAHETGHQYFYGIAGNSQFDDPMLDEGFTSFITGEYLHSAREAGTEPKIAPGTPPRNPDHPGLAVGEAPASRGVHLSSPMNVLNGAGYFPLIYGGTPKMLNALRTEIGIPAFDAGMRTWFESQRHGIAHTVDFMQTMGTAAGRDLTGWFEAHNVYANEPDANTKLDPNAAM